MRFLIRAASLFFRTLWPRACRFHPSCSEYACEAFSRFSAVRAVFFTARRLARCHPWSVGGFDPLPNDPPKMRFVR